MSDYRKEWDTFCETHLPALIQDLPMRNLVREAVASILTRCLSHCDAVLEEYTALLSQRDEAIHSRDYWYQQYLRTDSNKLEAQLHKLKKACREVFP